MKKLLAILFVLSGFANAPAVSTAQASNSSAMKAGQPIPADPKIKMGTFDNGLTYYIRHNDKPADEVQLRLVVNAGSILEDPDQRGLAHLMEHMNFNGTKHFKKNELVDYLQSIGVKFGADLNAYTGFDQTVFILPLPTDSTKALNRGFQVLADWAHEAQLTHQQIKDERGVVMEEYRLGLGANERMRKQYFPVILKGSRYAKRLPIGTKKSILHSKDESLRRFYHTWYRPSLQAVIAVGDLSVDQMYQKIKDHFAGIPSKKNPPKRKEYGIPNHKKTYVSVAADSEATSAQVQITYLDHGKRSPTKTTGDYRHELVERLFSSMINNRLDELRNKPSPPFTYASSYHGRFYSPNKEAYNSFAVTKEDGRLQGLKTLLITNKKVKKYGFDKSELERAKKDLLSSLENQYKGRKTQKSASYVGTYISNYLYDAPMAGISWRYKYAQKMVPGISLSEVSSLIDNYMHKDNRMVIMTGPPLKDETKKGMEKKIKTMLAKVASQKVSPYKAKSVRKQLMEKMPKKGSISKQSSNDSLGTTTLTLSNGAKVVYKKTDFKDNQILLRAFSYGGTSLYNNDVYRQTDLANGGLAEAGVAGLSKTDLKKVMAGKTASVSPYINNLTEGMNGSASPDDMKSMFQLIHLYFTSLNKDLSAFQSYINKRKVRYKNLLANPQYYFISQFRDFMHPHNPRYIGLPTPALFDKANYDLAYKKYKQRFSNAGDFTFYFVGDIPVAKLKKYAETYIASLPATSANEKYKTYPYRPLTGSHKKIIHKGQAPKSLVEMIFNGETKYSPQTKYYLNSLADILEIKLIENLREKESGVYTIQARASMQKIPYNSYSFAIVFPCSPENVDRLEKSALKEVHKIIKNGPTTTDLEKVKKHQKLAYKKKLKKNGYWISHLMSADVQKSSKTAFLEQESQIRNLTKKDIQQVAKRYLSDGHITGVLYPASKKDSDAKK